VLMQMELTGIRGCQSHLHPQILIVVIL